MLQIYCKNINQTRSFREGISLLEIYNDFGLDMPYGVVSAKVNNKVEDLNFRVYYNKDVEFLDITNPSGMRTYFRSLCFMPTSPSNASNATPAKWRKYSPSGEWWTKPSS